MACPAQTTGTGDIQASAAGQRIAGAALAVIAAFCAEGLKVNRTDHQMDIPKARRDLAGTRKLAARGDGVGAVSGLPAGGDLAAVTLGAAAAPNGNPPF